MGANAHTLLTEYQHKLTNKNILEIGSSAIRQQGASTGFYSEFVQSNPDWRFVTIDVDEGLYESNNLVVHQENLKNISIHKTDYTEVVKDLDVKFGFVYLDNFDYKPPGCEWHDWCVELGNTYLEEYGVEYSNENSAQAHLDQAMFLQDYVADKCVILFDDTFLIENCEIHKGGFERGKEYGLTYPESGWYGKGATAVPWLMKNGWYVAETYTIDGRDDWTLLCNFL